MTTDAKPLPLSAEELTNLALAAAYYDDVDMQRALTTIAQQAEQIKAMRAAGNNLRSFAGLMRDYPSAMAVDEWDAALNQRGDNE